MNRAEMGVATSTSFYNKKLILIFSVISFANVLARLITKKPSDIKIV